MLNVMIAYGKSKFLIKLIKNILLKNPTNSLRNGRILTTIEERKK